MARQSTSTANKRTTRKAQGRKETPKSKATRLHILATAAKAFSANGYSLTRLADIAAAADLHLTALYYYYDNKEALASDLLIHTSERNSDLLNAALARLPGKASNRQRIETAITAHLEGVLCQDDFMGAYRAIVAQVSPDVRAHALEINRRDSETWRALIDAAIQSGEMRTDVDHTMIRMALLGAMNWSIEWFDPALGSPKRFASTLRDMLFSGVAA